MPKHKEGKKNRKHGRSKRKPSHQRYLAERRWEKNKARKHNKHRAKMARKMARKANKHTTQ